MNIQQQNSRDPRATPVRLRTAEIVAIVAFLLLNLAVPALWGDIFPFTAAPMFRDAPRVYCVYRAYDPSGKEVSLESLLLQRIYDGNPPGYGVGIKPPETLAQFGEVPDEATLRKHVTEQLADLPDLPFVDVEQDLIGCTDGECLGVLETRRFRVERATP